jgi:hypothetical protein
MSRSYPTLRKHDVVSALSYWTFTHRFSSSTRETIVLLALRFHRQRIAVGLNDRDAWRLHIPSQEPNINQHCQPCSVTFLTSSNMPGKHFPSSPSPRVSDSGSAWDLLLTHNMPIAIRTSRNHIISSKQASNKQVASSGGQQASKSIRR